MNKRLLILPEFQNIHEACDILNRVSWGLSDMQSENISICILETTIQNGLMDREQLNVTNLPPSQESYLSELPRIEGLPVNFSLNSGNKILLWDASIDQKTIERFKNETPIIIDPNYKFNHEADQIAALQYSISSEETRKEYRELSQTNYRKLLEHWKNVENACLYLTGPSVEKLSINQIDLDAIKIICNSLVKNAELLDRLQPDVLMFSDPAYHFGISKYAAAFRGYVKKAMANFPNLVCLVPERYFPLTLAFLGVTYRDRIIGVPVIDTNQFNVLSNDRFFVRKTDNILTQMMIPVAVEISERINIFGADGREKGDSGYWKHAQASQISDQMKTIYDSHPSLARDEDVEKYYDLHCRVLEELIAFGEKTRDAQFCCLTPSHIPALASRFCLD
jgi:hypothetical protein